MEYLFILSAAHGEVPDVYDFQLECIRNFYAKPKFGTQQFKAELDIKDDGNNPCKYSGFRCVNDKIMSVVIHIDKHAGNTTGDTIICLQWLPNTLHVICIKSVFIAPHWSTSMLPRDTRFLYLDRVYCVYQEYGVHVNLQALPENMEELHIFYSYKFGELVFADLPRSLRMIQIFRREPIEKIFVGKVPDNFELARVLVQTPSTFTPIKASIKMIDGAKSDSFLQTKGRFTLEDSKFILKSGRRILVRFDGYEFA